MDEGLNIAFEFASLLSKVESGKDSRTPVSAFAVPERGLKPPAGTRKRKAIEVIALAGTPPGRQNYDSLSAALTVG